MLHGLPILSCLAAALLLCYDSVLAHSHWVITEDGKIQATTESLYMMKQPHDLAEFLRQDERIERSKHIQEEVDKEKDELSVAEKRDDPDVEQTMMNTDPDCIKAGKPLAQHDLFVSTFLPDDANFRDMLVGSASKSATRLLPNCTKLYELSFSMAAFDHLNSVRNRRELVAMIEPALAQFVVVEPWSDVFDFGHALHAALKKKPWSSSLYNLAAYVWRIQGDAGEAIECARRALHFSTPENMVIALVNLANILHQASQSEDALAVIETALAFNDTSPVTWFTAGQIYAASQDYNRSIDCFEHCEVLTPAEHDCAALRAAVQCFVKLENSLEAQHDNLQKTLVQLTNYQGSLANLNVLYDQLLAHVANAETKTLARLAYDYFTLGPLEGSRCDWVDDNGQQYLLCSITDEQRYESARWRRYDELDGLNETSRDVSSTVAQPPKHTSPMANEADTPTRTPPKLDLELERVYIESIKPRSGVPDFTAPTADRLYPRRTPTKPVDDAWPPESDCEDAQPLTLADIPPLFIAPTNKGFESDVLLNDYLNLNASFEHPLPWYPPFCSLLLGSRSDGANYLHCCDHLLGVQKVKNHNKEALVPEPSLRQVVLGFARTPSESEKEIGQRLHSLLKHNIGPKWVALCLSAIYWRMVGVVPEALICLRHALLDPGVKPYADVPLVQVAWLAYTIGGRPDDAIALLRQALDVDPNEPTTHFALGFLLALTENQTGSDSHLVECLQLEPNYPLAERQLKAVRCRLRSTKLVKAKREPPTTGATFQAPLLECGSASDTPKFFCLKEERGERCYLEEKAVPGAAEKLLEKIDPKFVNEMRAMREKAAKIAAVTRKQKTKSAEEANVVVNKHGDTVELRSDGESEEASEDGDAYNVELRVVEQPAGEKPLLEVVSTKTSGKKSRDAPEPPVKAFSPAGNAEVPPDVPLPEVVLRPLPEMVRAGRDLLGALPTSTSDCAFWKARVKLEQPTSTLLSLSAKGINANHYLGGCDGETLPKVEPLCNALHSSNGIPTLDHLNGFKHIRRLNQYRAEKGLRDAFENLSGRKETVEVVAARIAHYMRNPRSADLKLIENELHVLDATRVSWVYATLAALYWRVRGNATAAVECLRYSLSHAPSKYRDLPLISLANVYQQAGMLHSALIVAGAALQVSPKFVVVHFTLANILAAMGDLNRAAEFYFSTLSLQQTFEPAKERLRTIYCLQGNLDGVLS